MNDKVTSKGFFKRLAFKEAREDSENNTQGESDEKEKKGFFQRLRSSLQKTHEVLVTPVDELILGRKQIDEDTFENLEEILLTSDVGPQTALGLIEGVQERDRELPGDSQLRGRRKPHRGKADNQ